MGTGSEKQGIYKRKALTLTEGGKNSEKNCLCRNSSIIFDRLEFSFKSLRTTLCEMYRDIQIIKYEFARSKNKVNVSLPVLGQYFAKFFY